MTRKVTVTVMCKHWKYWGMSTPCHTAYEQRKQDQDRYLKIYLTWVTMCPTGLRSASTMKQDGQEQEKIERTLPGPAGKIQE